MVTRKSLKKIVPGSHLRYMAEAHMRRTTSSRVELFRLGISMQSKERHFAMAGYVSERSERGRQAAYNWLAKN